jgi:hypothetical protein
LDEISDRVGGSNPSPNYHEVEVVPIEEQAAEAGGSGVAIAAGQVREEKLPPCDQLRGLSIIERIWVALGLKPAADPDQIPSPLSRFGTSPRFVTWFLWIQILLGWLLATLVIAGVSGIVHKD